ncbi:MAG: polymer-forming cytoskeletal protein [Pseudomonadota bacterium]
MPRSAHGQRSAQDANRTAPRQDGVSVIGRDLAILGDGLKIVSRGKIQIEGEVRGDVYGEEILIGDQGKVSGTVAATQVVVRGAVQGTVRGKDVVLASTAHVEADVHHASLSLEQGAMFEGRSRRPADVSSLLPNLDELTAEHDASKAEKQNRSVSSLS